MTQSRAAKNGYAYQAAIIVAGFAVWLSAIVFFLIEYAWRDQLIMLALAPLVVVTGMFPNTFPVPSALKCSQEKISFTLTDALVLLIACRYGIAPAILVAGLEGFTSSRRTVSRISSNLFSFAMMALAAFASSTTLAAVLHYGFRETISLTSLLAHSFSSAAVALLVASFVHVIVNSWLFSLFFALREQSPIWRNWKQNFLWAVPIFLPTSAVASVMYIALQYDALVMLVVGAPVLLALYFGHRQYRKSVQERISIMEKAHRETIEALAVAINAKDEVTHEHVLRVQIYAAGVARILGCSPAEIEALRAGALLHDIGKIAVPDFILNKPGKLTAAEFEKMKAHTIVGGQILGRVEFPYPVVPVVRHHHERWDGRGYPDGLKDEEIPLTARILSVVDCFDAVREDRQYRKAMTREEALEFIMSGSGTMYDPRVVGTFITHLPEFEAEILAHRNVPVPTFGITPIEELSEAARSVAPAAGLAENKPTAESTEASFSLKELRSLYELSQSINAVHDSSQLATIFTEKLQSLVPYDSCALVAISENDNVVAHAAGQHANLLAGRKVATGEGVTGWVLANRQPFCNTDPKLDLPPELTEHFASYRTLASYPLLSGTEMLGALTLYSSTLQEYSEEQKKLLDEATRLLASALSRNTGQILESERRLEASDAQSKTDLRVSQLNPANTVIESKFSH
jgi:putative nucleotidyltransferase with HDIG domain